MKVLDLVRYDPDKGCFVLSDNSPPLSPFRWKEDPRPSIFLKDAYFRAKGSGTIASEEGLGYKDATPQTPRATDRTTDQNV